MDGPPQDDRSARRREQARARTARRRRNVAYWSVITVAAVLAVVWVANPGWSLRDGSSGTEVAQADPTGGDPGAVGTGTSTAATGAGASTTGTARADGAPADGAADAQGASAADAHERDYGLKASGSPARQKVTVPVLMYHRVAPMSTATNDVSYDLTVTPAQFREQMAWLKRNGYTAISQAELFRAIEDGAALPKKPVALTFDDGYVDATKDVLPVLEPLGWPATFFIISSRIGERAFLTAKQIKRLSAAGMDIGSHTVDHLELPSLSESSRAQQLRQSRKDLEKVVGHPVRWFCYPAGRNDSASAASVARAGYLLGYTTEGGSVLRADSLTQLPRVRISGGGSLQQFAASVKAASAAS